MSIHGNWVDLIILIILGYFVGEAFRVGFWVIMADFFSFLFAILTSLIGYQLTANFLRSSFSVSHSFSNALGFLFTAVFAGAIFGYILSILIHKIPDKYWKFKGRTFLAIIPAIGEGLVLVTFILTLIISLPIPSEIKTIVADSMIGGTVVEETAGLNSRFNDIFGKAVEDSLAYLIVDPESRQTVALSIGKQELTWDEESSVQMFNLVNEERRKRNLGSLDWDEELASVSRDYAMYMWQQAYFGHYSPEGENVGDRLKNGNVDFIYAAENLAMAPTVSIAHTGLVNSDGHRANILDSKFHKVGIGVVENGFYGKIFVQVFTD